MDLHIMLLNQIREIEKVHSELNEFLWKISIGEYERKKLFIVVDEILSNIIYYGFDDGLEHIITLDVSSTEGGIELEFTDDGKYFDPIDFIQHHPVTIRDDKAGGLGLNLISKFMNHMQYHRIGNKNVFKTNLNVNTNRN